MLRRITDAQIELCTVAHNRGVPYLRALLQKSSLSLGCSHAKREQQQQLEDVSDNVTAKRIAKPKLFYQDPDAPEPLTSVLQLANCH